MATWLCAEPSSSPQLWALHLNLVQCGGCANCVAEHSVAPVKVSRSQQAHGRRRHQLLQHLTTVVSHVISDK